MKAKWFRELGLIYVPTSVMGWILTILLIIFLVQTFGAVDANSHSASDTLYGIFPYWIPAILVWLWIGLKTSK